MQTWEYRLERVDIEMRSWMPEALQQALNQFGAEGWEAVSFTLQGGGILVLFKRPSSLH